MQAQHKITEPKIVAIFLYDGVELLDFAGPGEVFNAAGFTTYTVSVDGKDVLSQRFVTIKPQYAMDNAPDPDIIVFPGGGTGRTAENKAVLQWIQQHSDRGSFMLSVCTGANILSSAGVLNEFKHVTTWHGYIPTLQKALPNTKVLENTRFVDNGNVITTAGVSAGIDGSLHLVSRIKGLEAAKATAYYMEYDKWNPDNGLIDVKNEYIEGLEKQLNTTEKTFTVSAIASDKKPYVGEFRNLSAKFLSQAGGAAKAERVLQEGLKAYPNERSLYIDLAIVNTQLGKPSPILPSQFINMLRNGNVDDGIARFEKDRKDFPDWKIYSEGEINRVGYYLMQEKKDMAGALKIFKLIVKEYPNSANAYDSLGEAYLNLGNKEEALHNYKKAIELDNANENAKKIVAELQSK